MRSGRSKAHRAPWAGAIALAGAVVNHSDACAKLAWATTRAKGAALALRAAVALISTRADAPSAIDDELAAVTVLSPFGRSSARHASSL